MARALINASEVEPFTDGAGADQLRYRISVLFYGNNVIDSDTGKRRIDNAQVTVTFPPPGTAQQVVNAKTVIRDAIQAEATRLNYGTLVGKPQHADELLHGL